MKKILPLIAALCIWHITANAQSMKPSFEGYKTIKGEQLYFKVIGKGKPLLIIHGGPGMSHDYFLPYLEPLAQKYMLIFYDQRASGQSAIPADTLRGASYGQMISDIEAIRKDFGFDKINILAHSWGTFLAVNYALQYGSHVQSLILSDAISFNHDYDSLQQKSIKDRYNTGTLNEKSKQIKMMPIAVTGIRMRLAFLPAFYDPNNIDSLHVTIPANFAGAQNALYAGLMSDISYYDKDYYPELKSIKAPALVLHGDYDNIPVAASEKLKASFTNGKLVRFAQSGHFPFIEERAKYVDAVKKFLDSVNK